MGGGNLAWLGWPGDLAELDRHLTALNLSGLALIGQPGRTWLGARVGAVMADRIKQTLDPQGKFLDFE